MMIGIDENSKLVYEGDPNRGHGIWPSPFITPAHIIESNSDLDAIYPGPDPARATIIYREDSFDPVTRIRRGRFYQRPDSTPQDWTCEPHPARPIEAKYRSVASPQGYHFKRIYGFRDWPASHHLNGHKKRIALGFQDAFTLWRVISVERMITGDDLVTLQSLSAMGTITELDESKVPADQRFAVSQAIEKVVSAANRFGPESVVDRCRDAAQILIGARYSLESNDKKWLIQDLGEQVKRLSASSDFREHVLVISSGKIIARLHARKPNERVARELRPLVEEDASLALQSLSLLIREFEYDAT